MCLFILSESPAFTAVRCYYYIQDTLYSAFISRIFVERGML